MEQLLFTVARCCAYIQTDIEPLTKRVRGPNEYNWGKLVCVLEYMQSTIHKKLALIIYSMNIVKLWVDVLFAANKDANG